MDVDLIECFPSLKGSESLKFCLCVLLFSLYVCCLSCAGFIVGFNGRSLVQTKITEGKIFIFSDYIKDFRNIFQALLLIFDIIALWPDNI